VGAFDREALTEPLRSLWEDVAPEFAAWIYEEITTRTKSATKDGEEEDESKWQEAIAAYLLTVLVSKTTQINETTARIINAARLDALGEGLTVAAVAGAVRAAWDSISTWRPEGIADTEAHGAANTGAWAGGRATGQPIEKTWNAVMDKRTRPWHADANGQTVAEGENFVVGGEQLRWPGDTSQGAGPHNIVRCRCVVQWSA